MPTVGDTWLSAAAADDCSNGSHSPLYRAPSFYLQKRAVEAAPAALVAMRRHFPDALHDESFVRHVARHLQPLGFTKDNCIALVNTCRDEVCRPIATFIDKHFGLSFNISGLGGLVNCGKTGLRAAMSHSPVFSHEEGHPRERYVFFAFPHVSVGESGEVGSILRRGRGKPSHACGALIAIQNDAKAGHEIADDGDDFEYVTLKRKVLSETWDANGTKPPSLVDVTKAALKVIADDLERLIFKTVDCSTADYAVITGVQIHSGHQVPGEPFRHERVVDYVWPGSMYTVVKGQRCDFRIGSAERGVEDRGLTPEQ